MALTTDKIKVGDKFYNPNNYCETRKDFGLLTCTKVEVKPTKFQTNVADWGGYQPKPKYINRNTLIIHYVNIHGETGEISYWEDSFNPVFANSQEEVIDNICKERLGDTYTEVMRTIRKEYGDIFTLTHRISDTKTRVQANKIINLMDNLRNEISYFMDNLRDE